MTRHTSHRMHDHSLEAYDELRTDLGKRHALIWQCVQMNGPITDRAVMQRLGFRDMNQVRPRITELIQMKELVEGEPVTDVYTNRKVRTVRVPRIQPELPF